MTFNRSANRHARAVCTSRTVGSACRLLAAVLLRAAALLRGTARILVATAATIAAMAATATSVAAATSVATAAAAVAAAATAVATTATMTTGQSRVVGAHQGNTDDRDKQRDPEEQCTIHSNPPTNRYRSVRDSQFRQFSSILCPQPWRTTKWG